MEKVSTNKQKSKTTRYARTSGSHSRDKPSVQGVTKLTCLVVGTDLQLPSQIWARLIFYSVVPADCAVFVVVLAGFDCLLFSPRSLSVSAASFLLHSPLNHFAAALPAHHCLSVHREILRVFVSRCTCVSSLGCLAVMSVTSVPCVHGSVVGWLHFGVSASADSA